MVVAIAWMLTIVLRKNHASTRYWLWMVASVKFLLPFSLLISAGEKLRTLFPAPAAQAPIGPEAWITQIALPFAAKPLPAMATAIPQTAHQIATSAEYKNDLPLILLLGWACGALLVAIRFGFGWWKIHSSQRKASLIECVSGLPVLSSPALIEPGIFGVFRPVLLLPDGIRERLTASQLQAIIEHELCHLRRRDNLTFTIHMLVETLFWFHPMVWWIESRLVDERERACDELVVQSGNEAQIYAEGILNVCKFYVESPLSCAAGVTGADLKKRIQRIMSRQQSLRLNWRMKLLLAAAMLLAVALPVTLGINHAAAQSAAASAQDIVGTWQGTLHIAQANKDLRIVIKIAKADGGGYKATFYSIDQGGQAITVSKTNFENGELTFSIELIGGKYDGKISADGKTITGNWTQGASELPLNLTRATADSEWAIPEPVKPMAADANPGFDVVTIKPSKPGQQGKGFTQRGRHFITINTNLNDLIALAYGLHAKQIIGAPDWAGNELYDIDGVPDVPGQPNVKQMGMMVQKLLADRFQLKFHHESRELSVYAIRTASGGPKISKTTSGPNDLPAFGFKGLGDLIVRNLGMAEFATWMQSSVMDKPVVDQTGLKDKFDFTLKWTPDDAQFAQFRGAMPPTPPAGDNPNAPPSLYTAVQEQLGLKIEATKAPDDVIVIEHVEKPSAN